MVHRLFGIDRPYEESPGNVSGNSWIVFGLGLNDPRNHTELVTPSLFSTARCLFPG